MLDLLAQARSWAPVQRGEPLALATIVFVQGSAPRPVGTSMLVAGGGEILGSLSGGCVEGAVVESALDAIATGQGRRGRFSYTDQDAFAAGLTCGGTIEVHVQALHTRELFREVLPDGGRAATLVSRLATGGPASGHSLLFADGPAGLGAERALTNLADMLAGSSGTRPGDAVVRAVSKRLKTMAAAGGTSVLEVGADGEWCDLPPLTLLVESRLPAPRFLIFGANDFGEAMIHQASLLGYDVTLCDPRPAFVTQERFAAAHHIAATWPHRYLRQEADAGRLDARTVVCVLGHDPKFDIPLLEYALTLDVAYIGALGSRRSHAQRMDALLEKGVASGALATLHSPIGLDLGAGTPAEVAVSIAAGVIAHGNGRAANAQLSNGTGEIHAAPAPTPELMHA